MKHQDNTLLIFAGEIISYQERCTCTRKNKLIGLAFEQLHDSLKVTSAKRYFIIFMVLVFSFLKNGWKYPLKTLKIGHKNK